jgi:3-hydroxybutyryl-CoA dehydratase
MSTPLPEHLVDHEVTFRKTVAESDVYLFAGVTGDFAPNHVDEQLMAGTRYGGRIAHGVLVLGYTSTASTRMAELLGGHAVSLGFDRVRFVAAVRIGDTVTVRYTLRRVEQERRRAYSDVEVRTQDGTVCLAATHVLAIVGSGG